MLRDLHLRRHGLRYDKRDGKLIALRPGGKHIQLSHALSYALFAADGRGGLAYAAFRREAFGWARRLRRLWNGTLEPPVAPGHEPDLATIARRLQLSDSDWERFEDLSHLSAAGFLDRWFESDALKAALAADVFPSGLSPDEAGSALVLIWRYGQASGARHSAARFVRGGPSAAAAALEEAAGAAGAELRQNARVLSIIVENRRAVGVALANGEIIAAGAVLSSLDARQTLLELVPPESIGFGAAANLPDYQKLGSAQLILGLNGLPPFAGFDGRDLKSRIVIAERPEIAAEAKSASLLGRLPGELVMEVAIPSAADPDLAPEGGHVLTALLPYMPAAIEGGWQASRETLRRQALAMLERFAPGLKRVSRRSPGDHDADWPARRGHSGRPPPSFGSPSSRLLASYEARIRTPIAGLYLCGRTAEPVSAVSGRAGRLAAGLVFMRGHRAGGPP